MAKALTEAQRKKNLSNTKKSLKDNKVVTINKEAIIDLPIVGGFREYIAETLNYILSSHKEDEVFRVMAHIQNNFKDIKEDADYDPLLNSVWCLMTLIHEINHQAAAQGHTFATDEKFDESMSSLINEVAAGNNSEKDNSQLEEAYKRSMKSYTDQIPGNVNLKDEEVDYPRTGGLSPDTGPRN